jgi:hypothetical protein
MEFGADKVASETENLGSLSIFNAEDPVEHPRRSKAAQRKEVSEKDCKVFLFWN